jgi:AcrR family transcriptional regulator
MPAKPRKLLPEMARTQQQRREETVARLLDASIDTIVEVGYARASAAVIAKRAQVSDGALFRHFPTMGDFMAATAHEVMRRQLDLFTKRVAEIPADKPALEAAVKIHWDVSANATNTVMFELLVAARTDEKLRVTLQDVIVEYAANILDTAKALPGADQFPEGTFAGLVAILTNSFIGTAIVRAVLPQPEMEERQIQLLTELLGGAG